MKIELKRFTTNAGLSKETTAFAADVWVDGKKVGTAENDGHGGETLVRLEPAIRAAFEVYGAAFVPEKYKGIRGTTWVIDGLVEAELQRRHDMVFQKKIAKADAKEKAYAAANGWNAARLRHIDTWVWFVFKPGTDPKVQAATVATKRKMIAEEVVVL